MGEVIFNESLIIKLDNLETDKEALSEIVDHLYNKGYVKEGYKEAILERESEFPTGIFTGGINVAIPHADVSFVNQASIAVGILDKPVKFHIMDEPENEIDVHLIIMLALKEPHGHIQMLQKVVSLIQNQESIKEIISSNKTNTAYEIISKHLM
jgi:PTS system galactitol-specific IIA component